MSRTADYLTWRVSSRSPRACPPPSLPFRSPSVASCMASVGGNLTAVKEHDVRLSLSLPRGADGPPWSHPACTSRPHRAQA